MKLGKLSEIYYTAAEARKLLGIDEPTFQYWGKEGRIKRVYLPGRKQPVYPKKDINNMIQKIEATTIVERTDRYEFRRATLDDLEEEFKLARIIFGRLADTEEIREGKRAFIKKNPYIDYHLYDNGNFVGCIHIVPLQHQPIIDFLEGKVGAWLINPDNIEQFTPDKPLECLMIDALTTPAIEPVQRAIYAASMIANFANILVEWGKKGIEIVKVYGASRTPSGIRILKNAGFKTLEEYENGKISFELDVMNSDTRILQQYKQALKQWKQQKE